MATRRATTNNGLIMRFLVLLSIVGMDVAFSPRASRRTTRQSNTRRFMVGFFGGSWGSKIPASPNERDNQALSAIKAAIAKPKTASFKLIECEFPPLAALNKLGDGSLQSANQVDAANLAFAGKVCQVLSPLVGSRPMVTLLTSASGTNSFTTKAQKAYSRVASLKNGTPAAGSGDVFVLVAPSGRDYITANQMAADGATVVLINGFAKDNKSVPEQATMAYFLKPLTYNSAVAGYLIRAYPGQWTTLDATTKAALSTATDSQILVPKTNTPDLRSAVKVVQQSVDQRAIALRQ